MKAAIGLLGGALLGLLLNAACTPHEAQSANPQYENIGSGLYRFDDRERGVTCYWRFGANTPACILTGVGQEQGVPQ